MGLGTLLTILINYFPAFSIFLKQQMLKHLIVALFRLMSSHIPYSVEILIHRGRLTSAIQHSQQRYKGVIKALQDKKPLEDTFMVLKHGSRLF